MTGVILAPEARTRPHGVSIGNNARNQTRSHLAGCILWLREKDDGADSGFDASDDDDDDGHTLDPGCYNHPVVVLSSEVRKGKVVILILTSFNDTDLALRHPYPSKVRLAHLPIEPSAPHPDNKRLLTLEDRSLRLRKNSYVKTTRPHTVAYRQLEAYDRRGPVFALSRRSYRELVEYAQYPVPLPGITDIGSRKVGVPSLPPPPKRCSNDIYSSSGNGGATTAAAGGPSPLLPTQEQSPPLIPRCMLGDGSDQRYQEVQALNMGWLIDNLPGWVWCWYYTIVGWPAIHDHSSAAADFYERDIPEPGPWQTMLFLMAFFTLAVAFCSLFLYGAYWYTCLVIDVT